MSEESKEMNRRRRRSDMNPESNTPPAEDQHGEEQSAQAQQANEPAVTQGADSRVPPEARRMSASPYGAVNANAIRHPGSQPQAVRRSAASPVRRPAASRLERVAAPGKEQTRQIPASRIRIGYAAEIPEESAAERRMLPEQAEQFPRTQARPVQEYSWERNAASRTAEDSADRKPEKRHLFLRLVTILLLLAGAVAVLLLSLPEDHTMRTAAAELARKVAEPVENLVKKRFAEPARIDSFKVTGNEKTLAPADVIFAVTTEKSVTALRLVDEDGKALQINTDRVENPENILWTITMQVRSGYDGAVNLETYRDGEEWQPTAYAAQISVISNGEEESDEPPIATLAPEEESPETFAEDMSESSSQEENADGESETEEEPVDGKSAGTEDAMEESTEKEMNPEDATEESTGEEANPEEAGEQAAADSDQPEEEMESGQLDENVEQEKPTETPEVIATPTPTPEPTPSPTEVPTPTPMPVEAAPGANPGLIAQTTVYNGAKKVKDYTRPAKEQIHMPAGWNYTTTQMGVMTFRGNAFRTNGAVGHVVSADGLSVLWQVEAGSSRGASQTYYGYEWPGQPAIVKWSTQVREASNIDVDKQKKAPLYEVIIAGMDGVIRFLDLDDGTLTRSAINLGYPMKGTPSVHPVGFPYMTVGQYARKMKVKTGKIGLRQYNLYTQQEMSLIDGLDGKLHRALNDTGSFETSALIDWASDTMVTAGSNGLLYLTNLNSNFDFQMGIMKTNPSSVVMASRTKAQQKNKATIAVESSLAMYDRYVYYADMSGVLRCVDTNYLTTVWAYDTKDAVMAAVALDLDGDELNLYTANMLANRKKGNAEIRRFDALNGKDLWTVEIGVQKDTKKKEKTDVGVKASPVIGENGLKELVFFTVTGLSDEGRSFLKTDGEAEAAVVALEKKTGQVRWAKALGDRSESSPIAVYNESGKGWIIQCVENGTILLLDGLTGETVDELQIEGTIKASPAAYHNVMVIGTTGKGTSYVYGINIH